MICISLILTAANFQTPADETVLLCDPKPLDRKTAAVVEAGLDWLRIHQEEDRFWSCARFPDRDPLQSAKPSDGAGTAIGDVGVTSLAILAFLGDSRLGDKPEWDRSVKSGLEWLIKIQNSKNGLFGDEVGNPTVYLHAMATMAIAEGIHAGVLQKEIGLEPLKRATDILIKTQIKGSGWSYILFGSVLLEGQDLNDAPPEDFHPYGLPDTSVTAWSVLALLSAKDVGIEVPNEVFESARRFLIGLTDLATGYTGYNAQANFKSSRMYHQLKKFPPQFAPAMTAVSLFLQRASVDNKETPRSFKHPYSKLLKAQDALLIEHRPSNDPRAYDPYYWFFGAQAMHQSKASTEKKWQRAFQEIVFECQRKDGNFKGSWDPKGPWGEEGGRVADTALIILGLQAPVRYRRILK